MPTRIPTAPDGDKFRVALGVNGTRGDFQPYLSLALEMRSHGHECLMLTAIDHADVGRQFDIRSEVTSPSMETALRSDAAKHAMEKGDFALVAKMKEDEDEGPPKIGDELADDVIQRAVDAFKEFRPHLYITNGLGHLSQFDEVMREEKLHCPTVRITLQPTGGPPSNSWKSLMWQRELPTPETPPICTHIWHAQTSGQNACNMYNWLKFGEGKTEEELKDCPTPEKIFRACFEQEKGPELHIFAWSPSMFPHPPDWPQEIGEGTCNLRCVGNLKISKDEQDRLAKSGSTFFTEGSDHARCVKFLAEGPPPVYIGWGSMIVYSSQHMSELAVGALKIAGQRGIILGGWAQCSLESLGDKPELKAYAQENIIFLQKIPHEWLFPQCSCCVHHGGIGTMQASLAAGTPTIITPVFADQQSNAEALTAGAWGKGTTRLGKLKQKELGNAIKTVCSDPAFKERTIKLKEAVDKEDGLATTVKIIENFMLNEVFPGKYQEALDAQQAEMDEKRAKNAGKDWNVIQSMWNRELNKKYPAWAENNKTTTKFLSIASEMCKKETLWCVKANKCLAREEESIKSEEKGKYHRYAFLEEIEKAKKVKGDRIKVRKIRGYGPDDGWVSITTSGTDILERVRDLAHVTELQLEQMNNLWKDLIPLDKKN